MMSGSTLPQTYRDTGFQQSSPNLGSGAENVNATPPPVEECDKPSSIVRASIPFAPVNDSSPPTYKHHISARQSLSLGNSPIHNSNGNGDVRIDNLYVEREDAHQHNGDGGMLSTVTENLSKLANYVGGYGSNSDRLGFLTHENAQFSQHEYYYSDGQCDEEDDEYGPDDTVEYVGCTPHRNEWERLFCESSPEGKSQMNAASYKKELEHHHTFIQKCHRYYCEATHNTSGLRQQDLYAHLIPTHSNYIYEHRHYNGSVEMTRFSETRKMWYCSDSHPLAQILKFCSVQPEHVYNTPNSTLEMYSDGDILDAVEELYKWFVKKGLSTKSTLSEQPFTMSDVQLSNTSRSCDANSVSANSIE